MKPRPEARVLPQAEYPRWSAMVQRSSAGSIYALPEYLEILCAATGGRFRVLAVERGGEILGGVALYEESSRLGPVAGPRLLLAYNGPVLAPCASRFPSVQTGRQLETLAALLPALDRAGLARLTLKCRSTHTDVRPFLQSGWKARPSYTYVVSIADPQAAWQRVEQNLRRLVTRCEEKGLALAEDGDFDSFYRLHRLVHERKGAKLYLPEERFRTYVERLRASGLARLFHARLADGRSVAAQLVLTGGHPVSHTVSAGTDPEFLNLGASAFLRWKVFEALAQAGCRANDLTDAALNPVTHFKAQLGGDLETCLVVSRPDGWRVRAFDLVTGRRA